MARKRATCCIFQKARRPRTGGPRDITNRFGKFSCEKCNKEFNSAMPLLYHQMENKHLGFLCCVCDQPFIHKGHLRRHVQSVHLKEQFVCFQCPDKRIFTRKDKCREHQLKNHGVIQCDSCGGGFTSSKLLKEHIKIQHKA